jgi:hypothetical protein
MPTEAERQAVLVQLNQLNNAILDIDFQIRDLSLSRQTLNATKNELECTLTDWNMREQWGWGIGDVVTVSWNSYHKSYRLLVDNIEHDRSLISCWIIHGHILKKNNQPGSIQRHIYLYSEEEIARVITKVSDGTSKTEDKPTT